TACSSAESGGYTVHPAIAGPLSTNIEINMIMLDTKKNQYESMFRNPDAMSLAPICNGISKLEKVPLSPPVNKKNTIMVPWIVTRPRYMFGSRIPLFAHLLPRTYSKKSKL